MNVFLENVAIALVKTNRKRPWLADRCGIGLSTIGNWFAYDRWPSVDDALQVAKALGVSMDSLMGREDLPAAILSPEQHVIYDFISSLGPEQALQVTGALKLMLTLDLEHPEPPDGGTPDGKVPWNYGRRGKDHPLRAGGGGGTNDD